MRNHFSFMWSSYLNTCIGTIQARRSAALRARLSAFGERYDYEFRADVIAERMSQGRQALLRFEECRPRILRKLYDNERIVLSEDQERLLNEMRNSMLPKFYGSVSNVQNDMPWLLERGFLKADKIVFDVVAVLYPRRHGKTLTQAIVSAIVLISQVSGNVLAYNRTLNHARMWMSLCRRFLDYMEKDDRFGWTAVEDRVDTLSLRQSATGSTVPVVLKVFGNASDGKKAVNLRGTGAGAFLMNLDEFAFFHDEAFKVIFPAGANGAAIVMTSSRPPDEVTVMELLEQTTKTGRQVLRRLDYRRLCDVCLKEEETSGHRLDSCRHVARAPMEFRSYLADARVMALLEPFDDAVRYVVYFLDETAAGSHGNAKRDQGRGHDAIL
jgi:hypothetical protein